MTSDMNDHVHMTLRLEDLFVYVLSVCTTTSIICLMSFHNLNMHRLFGLRSVRVSHSVAGRVCVWACVIDSY